MVRQRGGTAPNIAFTLALLGEKPVWWERWATTSAITGPGWMPGGWIELRTRDIPGKFTASFFANTDLANNQIASFYTGAMAHAAETSGYDLLQASLSWW